MSLLDRYIAKTIIQAIGGSVFFIMGLVTLFSVLSELKNIGYGDYRLLQLFSYIAMRLPSELYHFSPIIVLIGTIIGLGILIRSNEFIVMRALGKTSFQISRTILLSASFLIILFAFIGETIGPKFSFIAVMQRENARNAGHAVVTKSGIWFHVEHEFIHVEQIISKHLLEGVTRYHFDDNKQLKEVYYAEKLILQDKVWQLKQVKKTSFYPNHTQSETAETLPWIVKLNTELFNDIIEPSEMSLKKLLKFSNYLKQNGLQASGYEYAFWQRIFHPLVNLTMVLIALPFVFNIAARQNFGKQLLAGILVGIAFFILDAFLEQICIVYQVPALLSAILPLFLLSIIGLFFMRRIKY